MKNAIALACGIAILLFFSACKKKETSPSPPPPTPTGHIFFHLHTNVDTFEAGYGDTVARADKRQMVLSLAQLYLSGITLIKSDNSTVPLSNVYVLKTVDKEQYLLGDASAGNYVSVSFNVGIDATANHKDPNSQTDTSLKPKNPSMWFGNTSQGYIFVNVAGKIDTSAAKDGSKFAPFKFQVGSDALLKNVRLPNQNYTVVGSGSQEIHIIIDYGKLFDGLNPAKENMTATYDNNTLAAKIAANIPAMFRYEL